MQITSFFTYRNKITERLCRLLISFNILIPGFMLGDNEHEYPLDVLGFTLIALWLYFYRLHLVAILLLLLAALINYLHIIA